MTTNLTCADLMLHDQVTLSPDDTVSTAFQLMRQHGMRFLPVVDANGTYLGVFTSPTLIKLMLPAAATLAIGDTSKSGELQDLSFYNLTKETFSTALSCSKNELVIDHLSDPDNIPVAAPNTPIMEGILLLHRHKRHVILVSDDKQFIGVLSINSVLSQVFDSDNVASI